MNLLIELQQVSKVYANGLKALDRFDLRIPAGEWLSIMGPSGSGKTTLLNLVGLLDRQTSGRVLIDGKDTSLFSEREMTVFRRETVGLVFQQFHLVPHLTALENVMLAQYFHSVVDRKQAVELLSRVGLSERLEHLPAQLSGGEQQRVCIARALINEPKILLADEPTGNLDEANEHEVLRLLMELHKQEHLTIMLVTHDVTVGRMGDRQIEVNHGRLASSTFLTRHIEEEVENALEQLWLLRECGSLDAGSNGHRRPDSELLSHMESISLVESKDDHILFTPEGERRAENIIRRHRLGECLFQQTFGLPPGEASGEACRFEHIIGHDVADRICTFLGHPAVCPHGHPIPPGACCNR